MLRKMRLFIIVATGIFLMVGCNLKEKIGDNLTEKVLEKAAGDEANVDVEDGEIKVTNDDGSEMTIDDENGIKIEGEDGSIVQSGGEYKWPEGQASDYVPKFNEGKISYIFNSDESLMIYIEETKPEDYKDYVKAVVDKGYTEDKYESSAEDMQLYSAKSEDGVAVTVTYINSESTLNITVDASGKQ